MAEQLPFKQWVRGSNPRRVTKTSTTQPGGGVFAVGGSKDQIADAKEDGRELSREEALEEVVADSMETMLIDGSIMEMMAEIRQQDHGLWAKIKEWFRDLAGKIQAVVDAYRGVEPDSTEGRMVADMQDMIGTLQALYMDALVDASENFDAGVQKITTAESGGVKYSIERTQNMSWDEQIKGALYGGKNIRRNDTLIVAKPADTVVANEITDVPLAIPLSVLTKAGSGKDVSHSIKRGKLAKLDEGIKNAPMTIVNPERNAVVFVTDIMQSGLPVLAAFDMNAMFDGDRVHKATSIHLQVDMQSMLENLPESAIVYVQKNELDPVGATNNLRGLAAKIKFVDRVAHDGSNVNKKFSDRDSVGNHLSAEQQEYFKDSAVRDNDGRLLVLYHQTDGDFTIFNTRHPGAGSRDSGTPFGIFMKRSAGDIGLAGKKQMALYANITNPLRATDREDLTRKLCEISERYASISDQHKKLDAEYREKFEQAKKAWVNYITEWRSANPGASRNALNADPKFNELFDAEDNVVDEWTAAADRLSAQAKEVITEDLRKAGYDGIFLAEDAGSWGRKTDAIIALDPEQVKNIANKKPTSNPDIRYSQRDGDRQKVMEALEKELTWEGVKEQAQGAVDWLWEHIDRQGKPTPADHKKTPPNGVVFCVKLVNWPEGSADTHP